MTTSYSAQDMTIQLEDIKESITALEGSYQSLQAHVESSDAALQSIVHLLNKAYGVKEINFVATISTTPITLDRQGRNYLLIFTPVAINSVTVNSIGITGYTLNLNPGWNILTFPDGTVLTGPTGTSQVVIVKATNSYQGIAI